MSRGQKIPWICVSVCVCLYVRFSRVSPQETTTLSLVQIQDLYFPLDPKPNPSVWQAICFPGSNKGKCIEETNNNKLLPKFESAIKTRFFFFFRWSFAFPNKIPPCVNCQFLKKIIPYALLLSFNQFWRKRRKYPRKSYCLHLFKKFVNICSVTSTNNDDRNYKYKTN